MKFLYAQIYRLLLICNLIVVSTVASAAPFTSEKQSSYILIINSYTESTPWSHMFTTPIYQRIMMEKATSAYTEHMNVMMMKTQEDVDAFTSELARKYTGKPPTMIVLLGNSAYVLLKDELTRRWGNDLPLLVCTEKDYIGANEYYLNKQACPVDERIQLSKLVKANRSLTVMYMPEYISETISLMKQCIPSMNRLLFLSDKRYISAQNQSALETVMLNNFPDIEFETLTAGDVQTDELIDRLQAADSRTGILYYSWILLNRRGKDSIISSDTYRMLSAYTDLPIFTLNDMNIVENGMTGGYYYPASDISAVLSQTIGNLLHKKTYSHIVTPRQPSPILNYQAVLKKGIRPDACPPQTIFYSKPPSFWEQYNEYVYTGGSALVILLLILGFRISSLNRKRLYQEKELRLLGSYNRLVYNMPIGYMKQRVTTDTHGQATDYTIIETNPELEKQFFSGKSPVGKKGSEIHDRQFAQYLSLCKVILEQNKKISTQYYFEASRRYFSVMLVSASEPDCIDIFLVDTSELYQAQQLLRTVNKKLSMSLEVANVTPWKWDLQTKTILCDVNKTADINNSGLFDENQLSVPEEEYFAKIFKSDRKKVKEAYRALVEGKVSTIKEEYRIYTPEKGVHGFDWVEARAAIDKRNDDGAPLSLIGSSLIVTDRKNIERELIEAKNKAEESNRLKSAFLANMSHEIRTPLNAIVGFSNILATTEEINEKKEYLSIIENNNALLLQLISDILDLSKIEAGTLEFIYTDVNINTLLREFEQSMQPRTTENVRILFEDRTEKEYFVSTPKNRLMQVLTNLLGNAIKFTEKGSIRFSFVPQGDKWLRFYVSDTGCGIPPGQREKIFERFVKLNPFAQGTGLGLSICQTIIHYLGGEIGVESEPEKGTTFWFTFPYRPAVAPQTENEHKFEKKKVKKDKLIVLIAEDNVGNFKLFESILKQEYILIHAWNGREAVELFKRHDPHIILMDINMPEMNGYEATREIRKFSSDIPIIAVTAYAFASDEQQIMNSGFDAYASKPLNASALKKQMGDLLGKRLFFI